MDEFKFVIKCFIFACFIVIFSQTKIQGETIENKASVFLQHSETAHFIRAAADGGVKLIHQGKDFVFDFYNEKVNGVHSQSRGMRDSEIKKTQQRGVSAESDLGVESNTEDRF